MKRTLSTALAVVVVLGASALAQTLRDGPGIRDRAGMFSAPAVKAAEQVLREVENSGHWQVLIETRESVGDRNLREVAIENAKKAKLRGLSIAIVKNEKKLEIEPSNSARQVFTKSELGLITGAFTRSFRKGDYDEGLIDAVAEIRRAAMKIGVRDHAKMFSPEAVKKADGVLEETRRKSNWGAILETVETLGDKSLRDAAVDQARASQVHGLYVLIAKKERKIYAQPSTSAAKVFPPEKARELENTITTAFKKNEFDTGLLEAVAAIRQDAEANPTVAAPAPPEPAQFDRKAKPAANVDAPKPPVPIDPGVVKPEGVTSTMLLLGGGALLLVLWLVFRRSRSPVSQEAQGFPPNTMYGGGGGSGPRPGQGTGYPPGSRPGPGPGAGPGPAPGYGYGPPAPGYGAGGYGAPMPPQQGGGAGGFMTGALGGAAGAIAGNILYDKFGRPHESQGPVPTQGGVFPHQSNHPSDPNANFGAGQPPEQYDPNAGVGGDWGTENPEGNVPDANPADAGGDWTGGGDESAGAGGDWGGGSDEPAEAGGDWGGGSEEEQGGGDWGGGSDEPTESGGDWGGGGSDDQGGGDWGGGNDSSEEQGGSW